MYSVIGKKHLLRSSKHEKVRQNRLQKNYYKFFDRMIILSRFCIIKVKLIMEFPS